MIGKLFLESAAKRFHECKSMGDKTFAQLSDAQMLAQPTDDSNSIAVIIRHLHGNMQSRWTKFLTEDGEKTWRQRDDEFVEAAHSKERLLQRWNEGWEVLFAALQSLSEDDLARTITIRSQPLTVLDAINRQLAHYSSHVGQIVYLGRWMKGADWLSLSIPKGQGKTFDEAARQH